MRKKYVYIFLTVVLSFTLSQQSFGWDILGEEHAQRRAKEKEEHRLRLEYGPPASRKARKLKKRDEKAKNFNQSRFFIQDELTKECYVVKGGSGHKIAPYGFASIDCSKIPEGYLNPTYKELHDAIKDSNKYNGKYNIQVPDNWRQQ